MSTKDARFIAFKTLLETECSFEEPSIFESIKNAIEQVYEKELASVRALPVSSATTTTSPTDSCKSGWNIFVKEETPSVKGDPSGVNPMTILSGRWKAMSAQEKDVYNQRAKDSSSGSPKKGHISGWNLYVKEFSKSTKEANPGVNPLSVMGPIWKGLSDEEKEVYNKRAKEECV